MRFLNYILTIAFVSISSLVQADITSYIIGTVQNAQGKPVEVHLIGDAHTQVLAKNQKTLLLNTIENNWAKEENKKTLFLLESRDWETIKFFPDQSKKEHFKKDPENFLYHNLNLNRQLLAYMMFYAKANNLKKDNVTFSDSDIRGQHMFFLFFKYLNLRGNLKIFSPQNWYNDFVKGTSAEFKKGLLDELNRHIQTMQQTIKQNSALRSIIEPDLNLLINNNIFKALQKMQTEDAASIKININDIANMIKIISQSIANHGFLTNFINGLANHDRIVIYAGAIHTRFIHEVLGQLFKDRHTTYAAAGSYNHNMALLAFKHVILGPSFTNINNDKLEKMLKFDIKNAKPIVLAKNNIYEMLALITIPTAIISSGIAYASYKIYNYLKKRKLSAHITTLKKLIQLLQDTTKTNTEIMNAAKKLIPSLTSFNPSKRLQIHAFIEENKITECVSYLDKELQLLLQKLKNPEPSRFMTRLKSFLLDDATKF